jgi:hypothetical protein
MKKNQSGFSVVLALVLLIVLMAVGFAGWQIYSKQDTSDQNISKQSTQTVTTLSAADSSKTFTYAYPSNWSLQKYIWTQCCEGSAQTEPDWTKQTQPITLKEKSSSLDAVIRIDDFGPNAVQREYDSRTVDKFNTYTKLKVNGYDALMHVTDFVGPSNAEKYKDHEYVIVSGNKSVRLQFRERYSNSTLNGENDFNASALAPDFEKVARSIKFLN